VHHSNFMNDLSKNMIKDIGAACAFKRIKDLGAACAFKWYNFCMYSHKHMHIYSISNAINRSDCFGSVKNIEMSDMIFNTSACLTKTSR
jgi:hypothetical protein